MSVIVDASVTLDWCFQSERSTFANSVQDYVIDHGAVVPFLWLSEVANGLVVAKRRGRITAGETQDALALLSSLKLSVDTNNHRRSIQEIIHISESHKLTAYDATYLELALRLGLPLATSDLDLVRACKKAGARLITKSA